MPRPDVAAIGTSYRRIPILSIGRDIYNDTRLILSKLEELYPSPAYPSISSFVPEQAAWARLFESWLIDGGVLARAAQLIPATAPMLLDPAFQKDRAAMTGRRWDGEMIERMRPEALVEMRGAFEVLESTILGDGRSWILGEKGPSLVDIEGAS